MQDPSLQAATASEPLTLDEEYAMQLSWRTDADKLTFIACTAPLASNDEDTVSSSMPGNAQQSVSAGKEDAPASMIGDVNLFLNMEDDGGDDVEGSEVKQVFVGEIEIMIASKVHQGKGLGRDILLTFMWYILQSYSDIMEECNSGADGKTDHQMKYLRVKIDQENLRSIKLFESVGFRKVSQSPNYFGELELRWNISSSSMNEIEAKMEGQPLITAYES